MWPKEIEGCNFDLIITMRCCCVHMLFFESLYMNAFVVSEDSHVLLWLVMDFCMDFWFFLSFFLC